MIKPHKGLVTGRTRSELKDLKWQYDYVCHVLKKGKGRKITKLLDELEKEYKRNIHLENLVKMYES